MDMCWLFAGLQSNRSICTLRLGGVDLQSTEKLQSLVPFLSDNSSLQYLNLISCISWPDETNILINALSTRSDLKSNAIDNEGAIMLAESLVENIHFEDLALDGNLGITGPGWSAFLCLVCNTFFVSIGIY